jgi:hypothetical protein
MQEGTCMRVPVALLLLFPRSSPYHSCLHSRFILALLLSRLDGFPSRPSLFGIILPFSAFTPCYLRWTASLSSPSIVCVRDERILMWLCGLVWVWRWNACGERMRFVALLLDIVSRSQTMRPFVTSLVVFRDIQLASSFLSCCYGAGIVCLGLLRRFCLATAIALSSSHCSGPGTFGLTTSNNERRCVHCSTVS